LTPPTDEELAQLQDSEAVRMAGEREFRIMRYHVGIATRVKREVAQRIDQAVEQAREEGKREALRAMVKRHWAKRFKSLPDWVEPWLEAASFEELERVDEATWDASSPEEALAAAGVVRVTGSGER
jgi:hypothetical protein